MMIGPAKRLDLGKNGDLFAAEKLGCTERKHGEFLDVRNFGIRYPLVM